MSWSERKKRDELRIQAAILKAGGVEDLNIDTFINQMRIYLLGDCYLLDLIVKDLVHSLKKFRPDILEKNLVRKYGEKYKIY